MPKMRIPHITGDPETTRLEVRADAFGAAAARGLGALGSGLTSLSADSVAVSRSAGQIAVKNQRDQDKIDLAEERIAKARRAMDLSERESRLQIGLDEARFSAEDDVPSNADVPGSQRDPDAKTYKERFSELADAAISNERAGLHGEDLRIFDAAADIHRRASELSVGKVQRQRDIDAGRASLARMEQNYLSLAADPVRDVKQMIRDYNKQADLSVEFGYWNEDDAQKMKAQFEKDALAVNARSQHIGAVQAVADGLMALDMRESTRLKLLRNMDIPSEVRKDAEVEVEHRSRKERVATEKQLTVEYEMAAERLEAGESLADIDIDSFNVTHRRDLKAIYAFKQKGRGTVTNKNEWARLWNMAIDDPDKFAFDTKLEASRHLLSSKDYTELRLLRNDIVERGELPSIRKDVLGVRPLIARAFPGDDEEDELRRAELFHAFNEVAQASDAPLDDKEQREQLRILVRQTSVKKPTRLFGVNIGRWGDKKTVLELNKEEALIARNTPFIDRDPDSELVQAVTEDLLRRGFRPSDLRADPEIVQSAIQSFFDDSVLPRFEHSKGTRESEVLGVFD